MDLAALLDGEADLDGLVLDVLPQLADDLVDLEALALLLVRHDGAAVLVGDVDALLLVGGAADAVEVGLAVLLEDNKKKLNLTIIRGHIDQSKRF